MNYIGSITDFFKSPKWVMNLLLSGLCLIVPIAGAIVVTGWLIEGLWIRKDDRFETFPDFDFNKLGKYLERGMWPVLVTFATAIAVSFLLTFVFQIPVVIIGALLGKSAAGILGLLLFFISLVVRLIVTVAMFFVMIPLGLRAILTQDFAKAFDFAFIKRFLSLTWKETGISAVFMSIATFVLGGAGLIVFCVGAFLGLSLALFSKEHLVKQLYQLYLSRGGEAIPLSPKLTEPPAPPVAPLAPRPATPPPPTTPLPPAPPPGGPPIG